MHPVRVFSSPRSVRRTRRTAGPAQPAFGPQGAEGEPNRLQQWLVPSPDPATPAHAVLFRPPGDGPFPLARDRARHHSERAASRANAAAGIPRAGGLAGRRAALRCWFRSVWAMAPPAENTSKTRAAATMPTTPNPAAPPPTRSRRRCGFCAQATLHPAGRHGRDRPFGRRVGRAGAGASKTRRTSLLSSPLRPAAAAAPMIFPTRSARRTRWFRRRANSARRRASR